MFNAAMSGGFVECAGGEVDEDVGAGANLVVDLLVDLLVERRGAVVGAGVDVRDGGAVLAGRGGVLGDLLGGVGDGLALVAGGERAGERGADDGLLGVVTFDGFLIDGHG